jgi:hypothetical protein
MRLKGYDINAMADNIGKQVNILPLDKMKGKIIAVYVDDGQPEYNVAYFMNGDRKTCYFNIDEVQYE